MKKLILTIIVFTTISIGAVAQVGIGNATPDTNSVLDLTNPNDKGLLLPHSTTSSFSSFSSQEGMLFYFQDNIFYRTSYGYNALSPWKYKVDGDNSNHLFFGGGYVGLGFDTTNTAPEAPLHILGSLNLTLSAPGFFMLGAANSYNLVFDRDEIQARNYGSESELKLNAHGGDVIIGNTSSKVIIKNDLQAEKVQQKSGSTYYDLVPSGTIVMFNSNTIPGGWVLCNGANGSPNLQGKFIVAAGAGYAKGSTGGNDEYKLATNQMPSHTHVLSGGVQISGAHEHSLSTDIGDSYSSKSRLHTVTEKGKNQDVSYTHTDGAHSHSDNFSIGAAGGYDNIDNRPAYYALVYIMKL